MTQKIHICRPERGRAYNAGGLVTKFSHSILAGFEHENVVLVTKTLSSKSEDLFRYQPQIYPNPNSSCIVIIWSSFRALIDRVLEQQSSEHLKQITI